jgi:hypothetical protein
LRRATEKKPLIEILESLLQDAAMGANQSAGWRSRHLSSSRRSIMHDQSLRTLSSWALRT